MRSVKLVWASTRYNRDEETNFYNEIKRHITDWNEVTDEEFSQLQAGRYDIENKLRNDKTVAYDDVLVILQKDVIPVKDSVVFVKDLLAERAEANKKELEASIAAAAKRKAQAASKKAAREMATLAALKEKYRDAV